MAVKNQAFTLSLGMIGDFIGLVSDLIPSGVWKIYVWSYYTGLSPVTQSYISEKIQFIVHDISSLLPVVAMLIVAGIGI